MPTKASAMPTEPIRMYFQEASMDARLRCSGTSTAEVIVVASIATHITATLSVVTATSIVNANRLAKSRKRHTPGPRSAASADTPATQTASSADRASTRNSAAGPQVGTAPPTTSAASHTAAATGASASRACNPPTSRGHAGSRRREQGREQRRGQQQDDGNRRGARHRRSRLSCSTSRLSNVSWIW